MNYAEKQALKLERYQELATKSEAESNQAYEQSNRISEFIPFGQPILIGHHSERHHRRDLDRISNLMNKSIELKEKAEYYNNKVDNILNPKSISSDDPEAINKLKEKLNCLEKERETIKQREHAQYELSNLSQNIRTIKERIKILEQRAKIPDTEEEINGVKLKTDKEDNRVKLYFPNIPPEETRTKLKRNGFKWSPYGGCWQRMLNNWAVHIAKEIIKNEAN